MHPRPPPVVPAPAERALDLRRELEQQPVPRLRGLRLDAEGKAVLLPPHRQRDRRDAAEIGERRIGEELPEMTEPVEHVGIVAGGEVFGRADLRRARGEACCWK